MRISPQDFAIEYPDMELEHMEENAREIEQEMMEREWAASFDEEYERFVDANADDS